MLDRYITTGVILLLTAATNGLPLADDAHLVMGGHYKTSLGKRAEPVTPQTQPARSPSSSVLPPTTTTLYIPPPGPPPGGSTQPGPPGTTGTRGQNQNQPVGNGAGGQRQPGSPQPGTSGGPGSPSPTGMTPGERKEKTEKHGGVRGGDQNTPLQNNGKPQSRTSSSGSNPKPKATGSTDLPGALPSSGNVLVNTMPAGAVPVPSPSGLGGVSSSVTSVRPAVTPPAGPPVGQGVQPPAGGPGQQLFVDPLNTPLSPAASTPPSQFSTSVNPAVQNPPLPGLVDPTLTQPLGATGNQPLAPQRVPGLARRQQVNGLTSTSTSAKPQKTKITEPKPKGENSVPELRYELAGNPAGDKPETVGVSGPSSRTSSTTSKTPTPFPTTNNGQPAVQGAGGPQLYNPSVLAPQLMYESAGGMVDTPGLYPNVYPPPNPGPVVMVNENTRTTAGPKATSISPPVPTRSGPALVHESIDTQDPDAAPVKAAPLPHDPSHTPKVRGRDSTLGPSSALRKVRRHDDFMLGPSYSSYTDLPLYENAGPTPEKPVAIGPAGGGPTATSPPNTRTQAPNPALLYESSGDGKDPVALPVIFDVSRTTTSATGPSRGPALRYEYSPGDNNPGAGAPAPILPTDTGSTHTVRPTARPTGGGGPALKYELAGAENQQSSPSISTVTTTVYKPQPTPPPPALKYEYTGAENPAANPTVTRNPTTKPAPGGAGQPGLLYENAGNGDPNPVNVQSIATSFSTSYTTTTPTSTPTPKGQQPPSKPLVLRHENTGQGVTDSVSSDPPNPADITDADSTHHRSKRNDVRERGFVGVDGVASAHSPGDHGKRSRRSREFRA